MATEMGEYLVGARLREIAGCDIVDDNLRPPVGGAEGQAEFDVLGLDFRGGTAHLCEVATHLGGLNYGAGYRDTADRLEKKHHRQRDYATRYLGNFGRCRPWRICGNDRRRRTKGLAAAAENRLR